MALAGRFGLEIVSMQRFANPGPLHAALRGDAALVRRRDGAAARRSGSTSRSSSRRPTTSRARACASCSSMCRRPGWRCFVYAMMAAGERLAPDLAPSAGRYRGAQRGAARRRLHPALPRHRLAVGRADVGHLVGVGRAAHLGAGAVLPLSRLHRAGERLRRADARRARRRDPGAGRRRQPADHQILGRLVEHAASAGERVPAGRADDRRRRCCGRC